MPELPETETIARDLDGALRGAVLRSVTVLRRDVLRAPAAGGRALPAVEAGRTAAMLERTLVGATLLGVTRRAKCIVLDFGGAGHLVVTPRFTGALLVGLGPQPGSDYDCLRFTLADGRSLRYRDVRRLGTVALLDAKAFTRWDAGLGPEPLDPALTPERFSGILRGSNRAVKSVLMDQRRLAGVGNIYANEACFAAGVRPSRRAAQVTRAEAGRLLADLRAILQESIALRGTTFRDYRDAFGGRGGFAARLQVYGRGGEPCPRCHTRLSETHRLEGRSTVWCRRCQR